MSLKDERVIMYNAIIEGDNNGVRNILRQGCSPDIVVNESTVACALILAAVHNQEAITKMLIRRKASLNMKDKYGQTAVMYACSYNNGEILSLLVKAGANLKVLDNDGRAALHFAAQAGSLSCLEILVNNENVDLNLLDLREKSAIMLAACDPQDPSCLQYLSQREGVDIDKVDKDGNSPLMGAVHLGKTINAQILLDNDAKVNIKNLKGKTALSLAFEQIRNVEMIQMVNMLLSHGAQPNYSCADELFLHEMIARGQTKIVQLMIVNGCTPRLRQCKQNAFKFDISEKLSPFAVALLSNKLAIAKYLLANLVLTPFDVTELSKSHEISSYLYKNNYNHCWSLLKDFTFSPLPLFSLSFLAVLELLYNKNYKYKIHSQNIILSQLPKALQQKLTFKTQTASLCVREWESIPLMFVRGDEVQLSRPINTVWPIGHLLKECQFDCCSNTTGYRLLRPDNCDDLEEDGL